MMVIEFWTTLVDYILKWEREGHEVVELFG